MANKWSFEENSAYIFRQDNRGYAPIVDGEEFSKRFSNISFRDNRKMANEKENPNKYPNRLGDLLGLLKNSEVFIEGFAKVTLGDLAPYLEPNLVIKELIFWEEDERKFVSFREIREEIQQAIDLFLKDHPPKDYSKNIINATPSSVHLFNEEGRQIWIFPPSGIEISVKEIETPQDLLVGIPSVRKSLVLCGNLPPQKPGVFYIVTPEVARMLSQERSDIISPDTGDTAVSDGFGGKRGIRRFIVPQKSNGENRRRNGRNPEGDFN